MKGSFVVLTFFIAGIILGIYRLFPPVILQADLSQYALYVLMFLVGISVGADKKTWTTLKNTNIKILLVPVTVIVGSLLGAGLCSFVIPHISLQDSLAVGSGFGYYSLSSIIITHYHGATLGTIALLANMFREITTLLIAPFLARWCGKLAPIASGGATSMDTTLPIITKSIGKHYALISVFSGVVLTIVVPFLVTFIIQS